jgi:hypothetical protein
MHGSSGSALPNSPLLLNIGRHCLWAASSQEPADSSDAEPFPQPTCPWLLIQQPLLGLVLRHLAQHGPEAASILCNVGCFQLLPHSMHQKHQAGDGGSSTRLIQLLLPQFCLLLKQRLQARCRQTGPNSSRRAWRQVVRQAADKCRVFGGIHWPLTAAAGGLSPLVLPLCPLCCDAPLTRLVGCS